MPDNSRLGLVSHIYNESLRILKQEVAGHDGMKDWLSDYTWFFRTALPRIRAVVSDSEWQHLQRLAPTQNQQDCNQQQRYEIARQHLGAVSEALSQPLAIGSSP